MANIFEKVTDFYPGLRCYFTDDYSNYYAGNILIVTHVVKDAYPGGVHKIVFDDGFVMPSSTAQEVLAVQHFSFIQERLENNEVRLSDLREKLEFVVQYPQKVKDIFGEFAREVKVDETQLKFINEEIERITEYTEFLQKYEHAIFSFMGKYVKEMSTPCKGCSYIKTDIIDMDLKLNSIKAFGIVIFSFEDFRNPVKKYFRNNATAICIQNAFEAELNAVGIVCKDDDEFGL